jgi:hypothetical protein
MRFHPLVLADRTLAKFPKVLQGKQAGVMSVVPDDFIGVVAHRGDFDRR